MCILVAFRALQVHFKAKYERFENSMSKHFDSSSQNIQFAIVTVSDTRTSNDDYSGDRIAEISLHAGHAIVLRKRVHDEIDAIRAAIVHAVELGSQCIVLTGGTGLAHRDVTIEAVEPLLTKRLDGFGEAFRRLSWEQIGPHAMLSRALAGSYGRVLIVVLPGSTKAVELAMTQLVLPIVGHAIALLE